MKFRSKLIHIHSRRSIWKCCLENGVHFVSVSMSWLIEAECRIYASVTAYQNDIIGSDNGLSPVRRQAIIWTNAGSLIIGPLGTSFSEIWNKIKQFSFTKIAFENVVWKMVAILSRPKCVNFQPTPSRMFLPWSLSRAYLTITDQLNRNCVWDMDGWLRHHKNNLQYIAMYWISILYKLIRMTV